MSTIQGSNDSDTLPGTADPDLILGFDGGDSISGLNGGDTIEGGNGNDSLLGGNGPDRILGGDENDILSGDDDNDTIIGGSGLDILGGGNGNDSLSGGTGNNTILGGFGEDLIEGGFDNDSMTGEEGNDSVIGGCGSDSILGADGDDTIDGQGGEDSLLGGNGQDLLSGGNGDDTLEGGNGNDTLNGGEGDFNSLLGGNGNDLLIGGNGFDIFDDGDAGDDTVIAGCGTDFIASGLGSGSIDGGTGDDVVFYIDDDVTGAVDVDLEAGTAIFANGSDILVSVEAVIGTDDNDTLRGSFGENQFQGANGNDIIEGRAGDDFADGGDGNDTVIGGSGDDQVSGSDGDDFLIGGCGQDSVIGGCGNDFLELGGALGNDSIEGGNGFDSILYADRGMDEVTITIGTVRQDFSDSFRIASFLLETDGELDQVLTVEEFIFADRDFRPASLIQVTNGFLVEGDAGSLNMVFEVGISSVQDVPVTIDVATLGGTATAGVDFTPVATQITIPALAQTVTFTVPILGDNLLEGLETFSVVFANPDGAHFPGGVPTLTATGYILDNEGGDTPTDDFADDTTSGASIAVGTPVRGAIEAANDHDFLSIDLVAGQTYEIALEGQPTDQGSLEDPFLSIRDADGDEIESSDDTDSFNSFIAFTPSSSGTYFLDIKHLFTGTGTYLARVDLPTDPPVLSVLNFTLIEGTGGGMIARVVVETSRLTDHAMTVTATAVGSSATAGVDFEAVSGTVTIDPQTLVGTIDIPLITDNIRESTETFSVVLSNPVGAILAANPTAIVEILDDDATHVTISGAIVNEGDTGTGLPPFTISLQGQVQSSPVVVGYTVFSGTATVGVDATGSFSGQVTIPAGQSAASIPVFVVGDTLFEGNEDFYASITTVSGGDFVDIGTPSLAVATIIDDDPLPPVTVTGSDLTGGPAADLLQGTALVDSLSGEGGNDILLTGNSGDAVSGGAGNDFLISDLLLDNLGATTGGADQVFGGLGSDSVIAGPANDTVLGEADNDLLVGDAGRDLLVGDAGNDALYGGGDADTIKGGPGDDFIFGEGGVEVLEGGSENDRLYLDIDDVIGDGGPGILDVAVLIGAGPWEIDLGSLSNQNIAGDGPRLINFEAVDAAVATSPVRLTGHSFNDLGNVLFGSVFDDTITGSTAGDVMLGGEGDDLMSGGSGADSIGSEANDDYLIGGLGADLFFYFNTDLNDDTTIEDYQPGFDRIGLPLTIASDGVAALALASQDDADVVFDFGDGKSLTLLGVDLDSLDSTDFLLF